MNESTPLICHVCWPKKTNHYGPCEHVEELARKIDEAHLAADSAKRRTGLMVRAFQDSRCSCHDEEYPDVCEYCKLRHYAMDCAVRDIEVISKADFQQWMGEVKRIASLLGWNPKAIDSIDVEAWRKYYDEHSTPAEAWAEEYESAQ